MKCNLADSGLDCKDNLRVTKKDCASRNNKVQVPVIITWTYCNDDTEVQINTIKEGVVGTQARYKGWWIHPNPKELEPLDPGKCVTLTSKKIVNVCNR